MRANLLLTASAFALALSAPVYAAQYNDCWGKVAGKFDCGHDHATEGKDPVAPPREPPGDDDTDDDDDDDDDDDGGCKDPKSR